LKSNVLGVRDFENWLIQAEVTKFEYGDTFQFDSLKLIKIYPEM
jgi:hypothetical protein